MGLGRLGWVFDGFWFVNASGGFCGLRGGGGLPDILRIVLRVAKVSPLIKDLSDDPAVFSAVYDLEAGKTAEPNCLPHNYRLFTFRTETPNKL